MAIKPDANPESTASKASTQAGAKARVQPADSAIAQTNTRFKIPGGTRGTYLLRRFPITPSLPSIQHLDEHTAHHGTSLESLLLRILSPIPIRQRNTARRLRNEPNQRLDERLKLL